MPEAPSPANLGAQRFACRDAAVVAVPPLDGVPVALVNGATVVSRCENGTSCLVLDYRERPATEPAYVERWAAEGPAEGGLAGLLLLSAAHRSPTLTIPRFRVAALAAALAERRPCTTGGNSAVD